jgi:DNA-binding response OmpR family regulator
LQAKPRILIVDPSDESREVLRTALEPRGTEIFEASRGDRGLELVRTCRPDVIVLDLECESTSAEAIEEDFREASSAHPASLLMLGTARQERRTTLAQNAVEREFVRKPYHYAPLIRRIEALLAEQQQPAARAA